MAHGMAQEHIQNVNGLTIGKLRQRCGAGYGIVAVIGHDLAERDQQEGTAGQGGVHKVLSESAEEALGDQDGEDAAQDRGVQRDGRRDDQGQQNACHNCGAVCQGVLSVGDHIEHKFRRHTGSNTAQDDEQRIKSEMEDRENGRGQKGKDDIVHFPSGRMGASQMRRR